MPALSGVQVRELARDHTRKYERRRLDVWLLSTHMSEADRDIYECVLTPGEQQRAQRFHFTTDRCRSIVGRGGLRWILSSYCGIPPEELVFQTGLYGKPALVGFSDPAFNVSHSGEYVLIGVATGAECGIDIERKQSRLEEEAIARRYFCPREVAWLKRTKEGFFRLWTAKEAVIKAVGNGLSIPLMDIDVTDIVEGQASAITLRTAGLPAQVLWMQELVVVEGYHAAVAVTGEQHEIRWLSNN